MFENILGQSAAHQLIRDIRQRRFAPAMLFQGPECSGKGSAALELGRVISCENDAPWNCSCSSCGRHRLLLHPDTLCLGNRPFFAEINLAADLFLREAGSPVSRIFFIRSIRKLLARFNPVLWEEDPKLHKLEPLITSLEEDLDELDALGKKDDAKKEAGREKLIASMIKDAGKLEAEGLSETIPIAQIRRAAWWSHLAPIGKGKLLIIENADRMQEGARNSLLKLLEEPPSTVSLVLCTSRPKTLLPTILSRLRPYSFASRSEETEEDVIRRIFRSEDFQRGYGHVDVTGAAGTLGTHIHKEKESLVKAYLDSFLPVSGPTLEGLAAYFVASVAFKAALLLKKQGIADLPEELVLLGKLASPLAAQAGLEKERYSKDVTAKVLEGALNFQVPSLFSRFLNSLLNLVIESLRVSASPSVVVFVEIWRKLIEEARMAVTIYNQSSGLALERLFISLSRRMAEAV
jgi:DNA polymerase-3 subunit gamma/tau